MVLAGISGCTLARELLNQTTKSIVIIEKSSSIGGRLATRRVESNGNSIYKADTGAQFITARTAQFKELFIQPGLESNTIHEWCKGGFDQPDGSAQTIGSIGPSTSPQNPSSKSTSDGHPRYASSFGFNGLIQQTFFTELTSNSRCKLLLNSKVDTISFNGRDNVLNVEGKTTSSARTENYTDGKFNLSCSDLFVTCPAPQAAALIENVTCSKSISFTTNIRDAMEVLKGQIYEPCICLLIVVPNDVVHNLIPNKVALATRFSGDEAVQWIASNTAKGIKQEGDGNYDILTVHCTTSFSKQFYDMDTVALYNLICSKSSLLNGIERHVLSWSLKKWRYAVPIIGKDKEVIKDEVITLLYYLIITERYVYIGVHIIQVGYHIDFCSW
jgi:predicted NAD/FAD-dependent oxidoreductase